MNEIPQRTFPISAGFRRLMRWGFVLFLLLALVGLSLPLLAWLDHHPHMERILVLSALFFLVFGACAFAAYRALAKVDHLNIDIDEEGLWYTHLPKKENLVPWQSIAAVKENTSQQRLELLDSQNKILMSVEYQLTGFAELRSILLQKTHRQPDPIALPVTISKKPLYHIAYLTTVVALLVAVWGLGRNLPLWVWAIVAVPVLFVLYEYLGSICWIEVRSDALVLGYPVRRKLLRSETIVSIELSDIPGHDTRQLIVMVVTTSLRKPIMLHNLTLDAITLSRLLKDTFPR